MGPMTVSFPSREAAFARKDQIALEINGIQQRLNRLSDYARRKELTRRLLVLAEESIQIRAFLRQTNRLQYSGTAGTSDEGPMRDPALADFLLQRALQALIDMRGPAPAEVTKKLIVGLIEEIRGYFSAPAEEQLRESNAAIDREPASRPKPQPVPALPTGPSPIAFLDATRRLAPGPGTVIYKKKRG